MVRDLRNGRLLHNVPTVGTVEAMVLKSDGATAWILESRGQSPAHPVTEYEVQAVDKNGSRMLAAGSDIDPSSLAVAGRTLYWTQGGKPFSASLD